MKILKVVDLGYQSGGAEIGILELKNGFEKKGHIVKILSSDIQKGDKLERFNDFEFKAIKPSNPFKILLNLFNPYAYFKFKKILKEYNPDIVHLHTMQHISPSILFALKKTPAVITIHGPEVFLKSLSLWTLLPNHFNGQEFSYKNLNIEGKLHYFYHVYIQRYVYKIGFKNIDLFIGISSFITELTKNEYSPVVNINNFVTLLNYKEIKFNNNLLFIGRIEKVKGIDYLIKAMPKIIEKFPDTKLTIAGTGGYFEELKNLIKILKLEKNILIVGKVSHKNIEKLFHKTSIVIVPSTWPEAFGKVGVEAMSTGRPVIATKIGGIPEWLDNNKTGYLINTRNSDEIANKTIKLLSNRKLLKRFGKNARLKAKNYSVEKHILGLQKAYQSIINNYEKKLSN